MSKHTLAKRIVALGVTGTIPNAKKILTAVGKAIEEELLTEDSRVVLGGITIKNYLKPEQRIYDGIRKKLSKVESRRALRLLICDRYKSKLRGV